MEVQTASVSERLTALVVRLAGTATSQPRPFPLDAQLSDMGITSLALVNLMLGIEIEFDLTIPQTDITPDNFHSVNSIARLLTRIMSNS